jgi:hypothetical protein
MGAGGFEVLVCDGDAQMRDGLWLVYLLAVFGGFPGRCLPRPAGFGPHV